MNIYEKLYKAIQDHCSIEDQSLVDAHENGGSGGYCGFTYYTECNEFYNKNEDLIYDLLYEQMQNNGEYTNVDQMISSFNGADNHLNSGDGRRSLICWYVIEEVGYWVMSEKGVEENA